MHARKHPRHHFEFLVLEHRPDEATHPQAHRVLECIDFSVGGLRLKGEHRYQQFIIELSLPHTGEQLKAEVEVVHQTKGSFGVKFVSPSEELKQKLSWWIDVPASLPDRSLDIGA